MNALLLAALSLAAAQDGPLAGLKVIGEIPIEAVSIVASELGIEVNNVIHALQGLTGHNDRQHTLVERADATPTSTVTVTSSNGAAQNSLFGSFAGLVAAALL